MLGLSEEIRGDQRWVGAVVGDDEDFGWPCRQVNAHQPEQLALGLGYIRIARPGNHVHGLHAHATIGHGAERLYAADRINLVRPRLRQRVERSRKDAFRIAGWGGANNMRYARDLRSSDAHDGCRDEGILATGDVTTNSFHRDDLLSERYPVAHLRLELV